VITLELSVEEVNAILQVLGDLPTKTGAKASGAKRQNSAIRQKNGSFATKRQATKEKIDGI